MKRSRRQRDTGKDMRFYKHVILSRVMPSLMMMVLAANTTTGKKKKERRVYSPLFLTSWDWLGLLSSQLVFPSQEMAERDVYKKRTGDSRMNFTASSKLSCLLFNFFLWVLSSSVCVQDTCFYSSLLTDSPKRGGRGNRFHSLGKILSFASFFV